MICRMLILLAAILLPTPGRAEIVPDLYRGQALVTGTQEPERTRGFRSALTDVLVKLTGDIGLEDDSRIEGLIARPHDLVSAFTYEDRMRGIPVHDEQGTRERPHILTVAFDPAAIDREIAALGMRKWDADRPVVAIWLGIATAAGTYVLTADGAAGYGQRAMLEETASRRGLPIRLPAEDSVTVGYADIAQRRGSVFRASPPEAAAFLLGTLQADEDGYWIVEWTLRHGTRETLWRMRKVTFDRALKSAIHTAMAVLREAAPEQ